MMSRSPRLIRCDRFRVDFVQSADRLEHAVFARDDRASDDAPNWIELFRAAESSADVAWPDSPPLQELHIEKHGARDVALLVGRAGKSHWSASIGFEPSSTDHHPDIDQSQLIFDIACRTSAQPVQLGSAYELSPMLNWLGHKPAAQPDIASWQSITLLTPGGRGWYLTVDHPATILALPNARRFKIKPPPLAESPPATIRWRFSISAAP